MWFFYNCVFTVVYLLMLPHFFWRMWRRGGYRRGFLQRLAFYDAATRARLAGVRPVWIHAVSVGEMRVAFDFMAALRRNRPDLRFVLTTATSTGHALAAPRMDPRDILLYYPADFSPVVRRALRLLRPAALVLVDGEFWPNLLRALRAQGIPAVLINGRISERSFRGYRRLRPWVAPTLAGLRFCGMQSAQDAQRILALGARTAAVKVTGSAKYDVALAACRACRQPPALPQPEAGPAPRYLLGASTWPGEETILLEIFRQLQVADPAARLILVPRHVERCGAIEAEMRRQGARCRRWSSLRDKEAPPEILLVDTTGDLPSFCAMAEVIFVGKSLSHHGGQNVVEPAAFGKAIVVGPHMENFPGIMDDMRAAQSLIQVANRTELAAAVTRLWQDDRQRRDYGERAQRLVQARAGTAETNAQIVGQLITQQQQ